MRVPTNKLQQMAIYTTLLTGAGCGTMYYLMQKSFSRSDYHSLALEKLKANQSAMDRLGAPPLKVHNIHLSDRYNRVEPYTAQIKIPVTGSKDGGYLYTTSVRDPQTLGWNLTQAVLQLREGQSIDLLTSTLTDKKEGLDTDNWSS
ncbi:cytochrome c oxidase assembly factor 1 homolog isoform X1 [Esox lucius]|uniref:Cytochrome c oxidase assembly factor 1 n=1 Tax=Esox lucius TaxID=8010 RepID=A0A3P9A5D9_ESOLU|nr:cytochrome c oxidase assembly factor 1 homolog isoform X1 [Esox lucius]XP_010892393.1 cytochrome c oxidase assembly factor 1 homolog isoform X1 [Esox lucius]